VEELEALTEWLKRHNYVRDSCIDIGANIGNHSLHFADFYEQVYAFEPYPKTYKLLEINAQLVRNLKTFNLGLSCSRASVCFDVNPRNFGGSSIQMDNSNINSVGDRVVIEVDRLDSIPEIKSVKIGLVKIDVEGHELQVLEGALQTIAKNRPVILFEQHPKDFLNGTSNVIQILKTLGYETFATIQRFPTVGGPRIFRLPMNHLLRLVFGYSLEIRPQDRFPAGVYSMIVAVP
jgi:FkbM family methyltransferase